MKMRYVRQQKKQDKDARIANINNDNPMEYEFPEIEEYFVYSPSQLILHKCHLL